MDRVRAFSNEQLSQDEKKAVRQLVGKDVLKPSTWTLENFTDEELLEFLKDAVKEQSSKFPCTIFVMIP